MLSERSLSSETVFEGVFLHVVRDQVALPDGAVALREYIRHPGAVAIVAVTDDGQLVMERQYRHPLARVFLEIPAGKLEIGEAPLQCAKRELREETGFEAGHWQYLGVIHPCIGYADERIEIFLARDLRYEGRKLDQGEFLDVAQIPVEEVFAAAHQGRITDGKTLSALFLAQRSLRDLSLNASTVGGGV